MKILLVSINASFMHTNLAIRCLKNYADEYFSNGKCSQSSKLQINLVEFTINQPVGDVLRGIVSFKADLVLFSTYIWNAEYTCKILPDIKKILPNCIIGAGGPEFGYGAEKYLKNIPSLDFIMFGEGEQTFVDFIESIKSKNNLNILKDIAGLYIRDSEKIIFTKNRALIENLDSIPFPYPEILQGDFDADHKIYYYESSRGCPFNCAYCLSSVDKRVRFKSLERTCQELQIFLDANVKLVKFVDRTYNLNPERYIEIWRYILNHHNKKTMFHFEIEAEFLSEEALEFLQTIPSGIMQFEMGVQSANKETLKSINRSQNTEKLAQNIRRIPKTIHQHLDLIAGLPFENLESFGKSFDFVMSLHPDALQLGFLKVLSGTQMEEYAKKNDWKWMENPVYETFSTPYLSFDDITFLKEIEILTDAVWNSGIFEKTMSFVFRIESPWKILCELLKFARTKNAFSQARKESYWFELLNEFFIPYSILPVPYSSFACDFSEEDCHLMNELLRFDFIRSGKKGNFPKWYERKYNKDEHLRLLSEKENNGKKIGFAFSDYEEFDFDVKSEFPEKNANKVGILFCYK